MVDWLVSEPGADWLISSQEPKGSMPEFISKLDKAGLLSADNNNQSGTGLKEGQMEKIKESWFILSGFCLANFGYINSHRKCSTDWSGILFCITWGL